MKPVRHERKVVLAADEAYVHAALRLHPAVFRELYPERRVTSVYFDGPGWPLLLAHVGGADRRDKLRVRWYGEPGMPGGDARLEIKKRFGLAGNKSVYPLPVDRFDQSVAAQSIADALARADLPFEIREALHPLRPVLLVSYVRRYLVSDDSRFRITLDRDRSYGAVKGSLVAPGEGLPVPRGTVLEVKYDPEHEPDAGALLGGIATRLGRHSKYVSGVSLLFGMSTASV